MLNLETFFTTGADETRAWTYSRGMKAPQTAGIIHTDFERGFIRAEVIKYDDYVALGSEKACRDAGKIGIEGKGIRRAGRRHHALLVQRLTRPAGPAPEGRGPERRHVMFNLKTTEP